jgi:hypothetical protein
VTPVREASAELKAAEAELAALKKARKQMSAADYNAAKAELQTRIAQLTKTQRSELKGLDDLTRARMQMEDKLVENVYPQSAAEPERALAAWFADIQPDATFLGVPIRGQKESKSPGVHKALAEKLAVVEKALAADVNEGVIRVRDVGGLRTPAPATGGSEPSMHCFGLAVDIDPASNPFVREGSAVPIANARLLMSGKAFNILDAPNHDAGRQWEELNQTSEDMREYFALGEAGDTAGIEARLEASPAARAKGDAAWWLQRIEDDLKWLRALKGTWKTDPKQGLMTLNKKLVTTLVGAGLRWGGQFDWSAEPGKGDGKDIMHFDLRSELSKKKG